VRAAVVKDGDVVVEDRPDPVAGHGQLLVAVRAAGLNAADLAQVAGRYPAPPGVPPDILGMELAGEVAAIGEGVFRFAPGDRVMAVVGGGAQAEMALVNELEAMPVPARLDWQHAGGFPEAFTTAHDALFTQCRLGLGDRLCIHGAAGGVGMAAVQLGVAAGARVVATARREEHWPALAALGALPVAPERAGAAGPFDVVLELVGGAGLADDVASLALGGRICVLSVNSGARAEVHLGTLMQRRGRIFASTLRSRILEEKAAAARGVEARVLPLVDADRVRVPVFATFGLDEAPAAYAAFGAGGKLGKIVLVTE
jgi:NADPH:quinone reductase